MFKTKINNVLNKWWDLADSKFKIYLLAQHPTVSVLQNSVRSRAGNISGTDTTLIFLNKEKKIEEGGNTNNLLNRLKNNKNNMNNNNMSNKNKL